MIEPFSIVIPARFASVRLPGKPLRDLGGKPMVEWVYRAAEKSQAQDVVVATDDARIFAAVQAFGGQACMTASSHRSGTDRILEVAQQLDWAAERIVVNLQGDEPMMPAENMTQVATNLQRQDCAMATLHEPIDARAAQDPNQVKLVHDAQGRALYFSRSPIPYARGEPPASYLGHIGIYAYRVGFIETFSSLAPCDLELGESLEQLRALCHGYSIHTAMARVLPGPGIDTEADLALVETLIQNAAR